MRFPDLHLDPLTGQWDLVDEKVKWPTGFILAMTKGELEYPKPLYKLNQQVEFRLSRGFTRAAGVVVGVKIPTFNYDSLKEIGLKFKARYCIQYLIKHKGKDLAECYWDGLTVPGEDFQVDTPKYKAWLKEKIAEALARREAYKEAGYL